MNKEFPFKHFIKIKDNPNQAKQHAADTLNNENSAEKFLQQSLFLENTTNPIAKSPFKKSPEATSPAPKQVEATCDNGEFDDISNEIKRILKENLTAQKYTTFFEVNFFLINLTDSNAIFSVPTAFIQTILQKNYTETLSDCLQLLLGKKYNIQIDLGQEQNPAHKLSLPDDNMVMPSGINTAATANSNKRSIKDVSFSLQLDNSKEELASKVESKYINHMNPTESGTHIDPNKTFDSFVIGPSNNMAFATVKAVAETPGKKGKYPSLYIYSGSGLGKTHLLHSVANEIHLHHPELVVCLITTRDFINEMVSAIQAKQLNEFHRKYSEKVDVLMIDDIHDLKGKTGTQNQFFYIFNELHTKGKQLIFTSDKSPDQIDGIEERIKTRLQWGLVLDIQKPDIETRIAIIKKKACELDLFVNDDIFNLIATSVKSSIRELEGCLIKLKAHSELFNVDIDTELAKTVLNLENYCEERAIDIDAIAKATSQYYRIPLPDLKSKSRSKEIARARHIAMYLSRKVIHSTQMDIGYYFGGRDHSSVIHAIRTIGSKLKNDSSLSKEIFEIENLL